MLAVHINNIWRFPKKTYGPDDLFVYRMRQTCGNTMAYLPMNMHRDLMNIGIGIVVPMIPRIYGKC